MSERRFLAYLACAWLAIGIVAFLPILEVGFMGDDWMFLDLVARAPDAWVMFAPLNLRYTRPLVVLVYYVNFHAFGLWPLPAHLVVVLIHVLNAWLVSVLALRVAPPPNRLLAFGAGLIFLLFAGHSEAIAWVAGMADAAIVPFVLGSLLLFDRALRAARPARWIAGAWLLAAGGLLAKETAFVIPALAVCYGILQLREPDARRRLLLTAAYAGGAALIVGGFFLLRTMRFGPVADTLSGMGTSAGQRIGVARMFLLRSFVPPGRATTALWVYELDLVLLAAIAAAAIAAAVLYARDRRGLAFTAAAFIVALAPALPFSISLQETLTERYIYLATVFSSLLAAWLAVRLLRPRAVAAAALIAAAAVQWHFLARSNATWIRGDEVFRSVVSGLGTLAERHAPRMGASTIVLLNMPDTIDRACVDAAGVPAALRLGESALRDPDSQLRIAALHDSETGASVAHVRRSPDDAFDVDVNGDTVIADCRPPAPEYTLAVRTPHTFEVRLHRMTRRAIVAYVSEGEVREAATIDGVPFGFVDVPPADAEAVCPGGTLRVAGWALDDSPGLDVRVEREAAGSWTLAGRAEWQRGTRPDVAAGYGGYPDVDRAAWEFRLPCAAAFGGGLVTRVRAIARDSAGHDVELGVRTVRR